MIKNIEELLNSPRSIEAMKTLGITKQDLQMVSRKDIHAYYVAREKSHDIPKALVDLRYDTLNKRRFAKRDLIIAERRRIIRIEYSL